MRSFSAKRGRPKSKGAHEGKDLGTPELIFKKLAFDIKEPLDSYVERSLITPNQHWCGIHLRWLYTLRYGIPGISAIDPTHLGGREAKADDLQWREAREKEYLEAMELLKPSGTVQIVLRVCVFNEPVRRTSPSSSLKHPPLPDSCLARLQEGLEVLARHWCV